MSLTPHVSPCHGMLKSYPTIAPHPNPYPISPDASHPQTVSSLPHGIIVAMCDVHDVRWLVKCKRPINPQLAHTVYRLSLPVIGHLFNCPTSQM